LLAHDGIELAVVKSGDDLFGFGAVRRGAHFFDKPLDRSAVWRALVYDLPDVADAKAITPAGDWNTLKVWVIANRAFRAAKYKRGDLGRHDRVVGEAVPVTDNFEGLGKVVHIGTALMLRTVPT